ncbi:MAG TPA: hypothetical protein VFX55_21450 [Duganella sp.]|nr:hypothetical protein [Duganella sp.]
MNAGLEHFFKNFSIFFKKTLKFPKTLPLPFLDEQKTARQVVAKNFLKFFRKTLKFPKGMPLPG